MMHLLTRSLRTAALAVALVGSAGVASAQTWVATLTGPAESPPNASPATGAATFVLASNVLTITGTFTGLLGNTTAAHIHCCVATPGAGTAGVATTTPSFVGFPLGVTNGSFLITLDLANTSSFSTAYLNNNGGTPASAAAALLSGIAAGRAYLNIHSTQFGGGEIRGFIMTPVPEPSTYLLTGAGVLGLGLVGARRRRSR